MARLQPVGAAPVPLEQMQAQWAWLNAKYFGGVLPPIEIQWSARLTSSAGLFISHTTPAPLQAGSSHSGRPRRVIRLSLPLLKEQPEREWVCTLAHEMIHQWQYDVLGQRPDHGPEFLDKVAVMARDGLHVTVYHTFEEQVSAFLTYAWRCVACGQEYHRQRRTIRPRDHRCGTCYGPLGEVLPGKFPRKRRRIRPQRRSIQQQPAAVLQLDLPFPSF